MTAKIILLVRLPHRYMTYVPVAGALLSRMTHRWNELALERFQRLFISPSSFDWLVLSSYGRQAGYLVLVE